MQEPLTPGNLKIVPFLLFACLGDDDEPHLCGCGAGDLIQMLFMPQEAYLQSEHNNLTGELRAAWN